MDVGSTLVHHLVAGGDLVLDRFRCSIAGFPMGYVSYSIFGRGDNSPQKRGGADGNVGSPSLEAFHRNI